MVADGVTDDSAAFRKAALDAAAKGAKLLLPFFKTIVCGSVGAASSVVPLNSNVTLVGYRTTIRQIGPQIGSTEYRSVIEIGNGNGVQSNVKVVGITFDTQANNASVLAAAFSNLEFYDCEFTGTSASLAMLQIRTVGGNDVGELHITKCRFRDNTATGAIYISPVSGHAITDIYIDRCFFKNILHNAIHIDDGTGTTTHVEITRSWARELVGSAGGNGNAACFVLAGLNTPYQISDLTIDGCWYNNTRVGSEQQGFAWIYGSTNTKITNNTANTLNGAFASVIFLAPGRIASPNKGMLVTGNKVSGWNTFWDPDSMEDVELSGNEIRECGPNMLLVGYGTQKNMDIHDNEFYNCWSTSLPAFINTGNADPVNVKIHDNTFIDDRAIPKTKYVFMSSGQSGVPFDLSDVEIYNNKFHLPNANLEQILVEEFPANTQPRRFDNNTISQLSGVLTLTSIFGSSVGNEAVASRTLPGAGLTLTSLPTIAAPTITPQGTTGSTRYDYKIVAVNGDGVDGIPSTGANTTTGNATLSATNYNRITWTAMNGAKEYKVLRSTNSGSTYSYIGSSVGARFDDIGQSSSAYTQQTTNPGGQLTANGVILPVKTVTTAYVMSLSDNIILANTTGGAFPVTLPSNAVAGHTATIKRVNSGSNNVTIATPGGQTIDDGSTALLRVQYASLSAIFDGSNWQVI